MTATLEEVSEAAACLYLRLAADPLQVGIDAAQQAVRDAVKATRDLKSAAAAAAESASTEALKHVYTVMQNNPHRSVEWVLARPDVVAFLNDAATQGAGQILAQVQGAWEAGLKSGAGDSPVPDLPLPDGYADDVDRMVADSIAELSASLQGPEPAVAGEKSIARLTARAGMAVDAAQLEGLTTGQLTSTNLQYKLWMALGPNPCGTCLALHGDVIKVSEEFSHTKSFSTTKLPGVLHGHLQGPPRHPNCRCVVVLVENSSSQAPAVMKAQAKKKWSSA